MPGERSSKSASLDETIPHRNVKILGGSTCVTRSISQTKRRSHRGNFSAMIHFCRIFSPPPPLFYYRVFPPMVLVNAHKGVVFYFFALRKRPTHGRNIC